MHYLRNDYTQTNKPNVKFIAPVSIGDSNNPRDLTVEGITRLSESHNQLLGYIGSLASQTYTEQEVLITRPLDIRLPNDDFMFINCDDYTRHNIPARTVRISGNLRMSGDFSITDATKRQNATNELINSLSEVTSDPTDNDYYIAQYAGGGTTTTTYHRRPISALWNYIKSKIQAIALNTIHIARGGSIYADGTKANYPIIKMKDNTSDAYGNGIVIGGGGAVVIGGGESADSYYSGASLSAGSEEMAVTNDGAITFVSNLQDGYANRKTMTFDTSGNLTVQGKVKGVVEGASYRSEGTSSAKLKIKINSTANWMLCFTVVLYQSYRETKIMVSGYQYGSNYWYSPQAVVLGDSNVNGNINVYFGYDSTNNLWVGFDQANYTGIAIVDVVNGYKAVADYSSLFTITSVSSLGGTTQTTITATTPKRLPVDNTITKGSSGLQFEQISGATGNPTNDWYSHLIMNHANSGGYYVDFAFCFHSNTYKIRRQVNGSLTDWVEMIHSGNIGSQSVSYASNASSADYTRGTAYCATDGATSAKIASMRGFVLQAGIKFPITFTNTNSVNSAITLNINSTGAKTIVINGIATQVGNSTLPAGTYMCLYDGTYYNIETSSELVADNTRQGAYCATAAGTAAKVANMRGWPGPAYRGVFLITFLHSNTYNGQMTLSVNGTTAKPIYIDGVISSSTNKTIPDGTFMCQDCNDHYDISVNYCVGTSKICNTAKKIRTSEPSSPEDGDIWIQ